MAFAKAQAAGDYLMDFRLDNLGVLFGLFALAIPIVLHLLQRRRFEVLDWGAMQFLPDSVARQSRRWLDELLLLLLRMGMIALIVIALATPFSTSAWLAPLADQGTRDVVLVFDGSYSMDLRHSGQPTPWDEAVAWARSHWDQAGRGDRFVLVLARQTPSPTEEEFTSDLDSLRAKIAELPMPRGNPDMPRALAAAWRLLQTRSKATTKEIIVLTDQQHFGWADSATLAALDNLGSQWSGAAAQATSDGLAVPSLRVVKTGAELPKELPNYALAPLTTTRGVAMLGQKITFQSALHLDGFDKYVRPRHVKAMVDGKMIVNLPLPENLDLKQGQIPLSFPHRFDKEGTHYVSLMVEADESLDVLPGDNEQSIVVDIVKDLPILLVDGDKQLGPASSGFFLQRALGAKQPIPPSALTATALTDHAVLVLADVSRLEPGQIEAVDQFLVEGGGLLIVAGERVAKERTFYNEQLYRQGQGWLPAKLLGVGGAKDGVHPEPRTFQHPALELFRASAEGGLTHARFNHWWRTQPDLKGRATAIAMLSNGDPFLIEMPYKKGRVVLSTVPLDRRWDSTLPSTWEYPILVHELAYYLAGSRRSAKAEPPRDLRESNLTRCTAEDWRKVQDRLPIVWHAETTPRQSPRQDLWWLVLLAVVGFLCGEVWMTRRMALARGR